MTRGERSQQPVTPEKQIVSQDPTPRKEKTTIEEWEQQTKIRNRIHEQMREEMLECPVDAFLADYSPFLPGEALVGAATQALVRKQRLVLNERGEPGRWQEFDEEPRYSPSETKVFKPLQTIANVFDDDLEKLNGRQRNFFYRDCPYDEVKSEIAGCNFRMDACFTGNPDHAQRRHIICSETAVAAEFKKFTQDFEDNRVQLISVASHIMNDDPCRMWMYGITIEDTEMAVWYFSRSHSVKSKTFNFMTDIKTFVQVFLSFVYATREEMGYDPTVHRIVEDNKSNYVYEIPTKNGTRYFKTDGLLAHQRVICITGRTTRVWKAVEVNGFEGNGFTEKPNGDMEVALKDVWLDDGSKTEKQKLDAIFDRLQTIKEDAYGWAPRPLQSKLNNAFVNEGYKDYFMEIVCDSFNLGRSKETSVQATPAPEILDPSVKAVDDRKGKSVEDPNMLADSTQRRGYNHSTQDNSRGVSHFKVALTVKSRSYKAKRQYRLVYKEVGVSLDRVETLETAFAALLDAYIALVLMYLAGWVHRDVSAGNIIAVKRSAGTTGGKLSDLEYAKHCEDESGSSDPKTGTAFFMPLEIHMGTAYKDTWITSDPHSPTDSDSDSDADPFDDLSPVDENIFSHQTMMPPSPPPPPPLKYRFQHGFESLWWVALYTLIHRVDHPAGKELSKMIFTSTSLPSLARRQLFQHEGAVLRELQKSLHPALQHHSIMGPMNAIAQHLYRSYFMDEPVDLGKLFRHIFGKLSKICLRIKTQVEGVTFDPIGYVQPKKRAHPGTSSKPRDDDDYKEEEQESGSDDAVPKRKKKASTGVVIRR